MVAASRWPRRGRGGGAAHTWPGTVHTFLPFFPPSRRREIPDRVGKGTAAATTRPRETHDAPHTCSGGIGQQPPVTPRSRPRSGPWCFKENLPVLLKADTHLHTFQSASLASPPTLEARLIIGPRGHKLMWRPSLMSSASMKDRDSLTLPAEGGKYLHVSWSLEGDRDASVHAAHLSGRAAGRRGC